MRRVLVRVLGALSLGALLAVGVVATASAADAAPSAVSSASAVHVHPDGGGDWWT